MKIVGALLWIVAAVSFLYVGWVNYVVSGWLENGAELADPAQFFGRCLAVLMIGTFSFFLGNCCYGD